MKRLLLFVVLLAAGLTALKFAIGEEDAVRQTSADPEEKTEQQREPATPPGVRVNSGKINTTVSQSGKLVFPKRREVDLGDGTVRKETVFVLRAEDSRPIGDGLQQLTDVRLELFDDNEHAATVIASRAFLELGRDANGQPRIDEQKEIDLRDTVVTSEPNSRLAGLRLELGDAKVNVGEQEIQLTTLTDQPVSLQLQGRRSATLTGRGATARLPRSKASSLQQASVTILSEPLLEAEDVRVRASGRMHYVEDTVTGAARITLDDDVELDLERGRLAMTTPGSAPASTRSAARGDQFTGWLLRARPGDAVTSNDGIEREDLIWQRLVLAGAPATIEVPGAKVETPRVTVRPGPLGDPYVVTAHGGPSRVEQTELLADSDLLDVVVGTSPRRIHLIRPGDATGALHRALGFPRWTTRALEQQQLVVFTDRSTLESGARKVTASEGLVIARRLDSGNSVVEGYGEVELLQRGVADAEDAEARPDLVATGSDGLVLRLREDEERFRLGPKAAAGAAGWQRHRYEVDYGDARVRGLGTCEVVRRGARTDLTLRAPFDEITADFGAEGTKLRNVRQLRARLDEDRAQDLDVAGLPLRAELVRGEERLAAQAPRLRQIGPRSLQLLPMDLDESPWNELSESARTPRLTRTWRAAGEDGASNDYQVEVLGPRIDVHQTGARTALVDAHADEVSPARIYAVLPRAGSAQPATLTCASTRLRLVPFVVSPEVAAVHFTSSAQRLLATHALAQPWLLVDDVRAFELDDDQQGHVEGTGHQLLISQGSGSALFVGDPDAQTPAVVRRRHEGREVVVRGARVRVRNEEDLRLSALGTFEDRSTMLAPTMTLHEAEGRGLLSHMQAVCRGDIHVEPEAVRFTGPVEASSLLPDGELDPQGLRIDARRLLMKRQQATGDVATVEGDDVLVDWTRLGAAAARVELDLLRETCVASDPKAAVVTTPDGRELRSPRISVNYLTWEVSTGPSSARQNAPETEIHEAVPR